MAFSWFRTRNRHHSRVSARSQRTSLTPPRRFRPLLEPLEDRLAPATFVVNSTADDLTGTGLMGTLRYCVREARMHPDAQNFITFDNALQGATILLRLPLPDINNKITTIQGFSSAVLTVRRDPTATSNFQVFRIASDAVTTISNLTISGGNSIGGAGGGIRNEGMLTLESCVVTDNRAALIGGGILNSGTLILRGTTVSHNRTTAEGSQGGGIWNDRTLIIEGLPAIASIVKSSVTLNNSGGTGGGIYISASGTISLADSEVSGNIASGDGGGIYVSPAAAVDALQVRKSLLWNNQAQGLGKGGAIFTGRGGRVSNTTINGNTANKGGGIAAATAAVAEFVKLTNVTDADNRAIRVEVPRGPGGAAGPLGFDPGGVGGGLYVEPGAQVEVVNTIIAGNTADEAGPDVYGVVISLGYNLIRIEDGSMGWDRSTDLLGTAVRPMEPLLNPLGDYGGPTLSRTLQRGSPALNRGNLAAIDDDTDQRGADRLVDGRVDIGAVEMQPEELSGLASRPFRLRVRR